MEEGKKAADFTLKDQDGNIVKLSSFKGKKVALYFYPKDFTSGCTKQACNIRDNHSRLRNIVVLGVSPDDEQSHAKFRAKEKLSFPLLADPDKKVATKYGVWVEKSMYGRKYMGIIRTTFLIDETGIIKKIIKKPDVSDHAREILDGFAE